MSEANSGRVNRGDPSGARPANAFGDTVRRLREGRNLTQTTLAARMEKSVSYLSLIESGRRKPTHRVLENVLSALDLTSAEATELKVTAGIPSTPLDNAIHQCIAALDDAVGADVYDRHLLRQDLTAILAGWRDSLQARLEMDSGHFDTAQTLYARVASDPSMTPLLLANANIRLADIQEKAGQFKDSEAAIQRANGIVQPQALTWGLALRAEILGTQGFINARAGQSYLAKFLTDQGKLLDEKLLETASAAAATTEDDSEAVIVAKIGIANSFSRLALNALFVGSAAEGMSYAQDGLNHVPEASQRDVARTRLRLQALQAWANELLGEYAKARTQREAVLREYALLGDNYGIAKSQTYLADGSRAELESMLGKRGAEVITPEQRRHDFAKLREGTSAEDRERRERIITLLEQAIDAYQESITGLMKVGDQVLLCRALRNLGDLLRYRWLLHGRQEDRNASASYLNQALTAEKAMNEGKEHTGRRLPNVYESLAELAWDNGSLAAARDHYENAQIALEAPQVTTTDASAENMRSRITQALNQINATLGTTTPTAQRPAQSPDTSQSVRTFLAPPPTQGERRVMEQLEQLIIPTLRALVRDGLATYSDASDAWAETLCELEKQHGPRYLAQPRISKMIFAKSLPMKPESLVQWRERRLEQIRKNVNDAKASNQRAYYDDICSAADVEKSLGTRLEAPEHEHFTRALDFLQNAGAAYQITRIPFDLPISFAIKGKLLLIEVPKELAQAQLRLTLNDDGEYVCFRIEQNAMLMQQMVDIFSQLRRLGQQTTLAGSDAAAWLDRTHTQALAAELRAGSNL